MTNTKSLLLAVAVAAMAFTVSCTSDIETAEDILAKQSSSSEGDSSPSVVPSSSSVAQSSSSIEPSSSSEIVSSSSVAPSSSSVSSGSSYAYCIKDGSCLEGPFAFSDCVSINGSPSNSCTVAPSSSSEGLCAGFVKGTKRLHYGKEKEQFCDERDGKEYVYVVIGTQTWMAENLNYSVIGSSKCYNSFDSNCNIYGGLYNWNTAKTACPEGWHLPSRAEWEVMTAFIGGTSTEGKKLKATSGWNSNGNGTDQYGFSALPGGKGDPDGSFIKVGEDGNWWSASEDNNINAYSRDMDYYYIESAYWNSNPKSRLHSVRCVKEDGGENFDGTWNHNSSTLINTLIISGDYYTLKSSGENLGKGNISYGNSTFTITSTHAWDNNNWVPFTETVTGNYSLHGTTMMTISNVQGRYDELNGVWTKQ